MSRIILALAALAALPAAAQTQINLPDSLYTPGDTVTWVKRLTYYCEGPAWHPATGRVTFSQIGNPGTSANRPDWPLWVINPGQDTGTIFYTKGQSNGQILDPAGRLVVIQRDAVIRFAGIGAPAETLVVSGANGVSFNANGNTDGSAGNDITFGANGDFYFTNLGSGVFYVDTAGTLSQVVSNASSSNGIFWVEEDSAVYVHEGRYVRRYPRQPDGTLGTRTNFIDQQGMGADGGCMDSHDNRWVADYSGGQIRVFNAAGEALGAILMRGVSGSYNVRGGNAGNASNCAFGGPDLKTLYITGDGGLYSLPVKIPGRLLPGLVTAVHPFVKRDVGNRSPGALMDAAPRDILGRLLPGARTGPVLKVFPLTEEGR